MLFRSSRRRTHSRGPGCDPRAWWCRSRSTSITKVIGNQFALEGDLTLHGVTKKVTLKMMYNGNVFDDKSKERRYGFTITGNINKNDFGVGTSFPEAVVGNKIAIVSNLEFVKK